MNVGVRRAALLAIAMAGFTAAASRAEPTAATCRFTRVATIPLTLHAQGVPSFDGSVEGHPVRMVPNTASWTTALPLALAESLDKKLGHMNEQAVGGSRISPRYRSLVERAHRVLFANSQHRFYFQYLGGHLFLPEPPATP